jgi:methylmalonyl-CoA mutase N-terminal domain/subunit
MVSPARDRPSAYEHQQAVDSGETVVVGVNRFAIKERPSRDICA